MSSDDEVMRILRDIRVITAIGDQIQTGRFVHQVRGFVAGLLFGVVMTLLVSGA